MYIILKDSLIDLLDSAIGRPLPDIQMLRTGRMKYTFEVDERSLISTSYDDAERQKVIDDLNREKNRYESDEDYKNHQNSTKEKLENQPNIGLNIVHSFWLHNNLIQVNGIKVNGESRFTSLIISQLYYITDKYGDPSFEDLKQIVWKFTSGKSLVIILPRKYTKEKYFEYETFSVLYGQTHFLEKYDIWKEGA